MNRCQFFSPTRVVFGLLLLAALVVGGLAWVSVAALRVEAAQQDADARHAATSRERFALWRLDGFLLPTLGLENNRPYSHFHALYAPSPVALDAADNLTADPGRIPSPLLTADLPPWMMLHFQLDPEHGWESPQVISFDLSDRLNAEPFGLYLTNVTDERAALLAALRTKFPAADAVRMLADQERSEPAEPPFLVPVPHADDPIRERPAPFICPDVIPGWSKPGSLEAVACGRGGPWCDTPDPVVAQADLSKNRAEELARKLADEQKAKDQYAQRVEEQNPLPQPPARSAGRGAVPETDASRDAAVRKSSTDNVLGSRAAYEPGGKIQNFNPPPAPGLGRGNARGNEGKGPTLIAPTPDAKELEKQAAEWADRARHEIAKLKELKDSQQAKDSPGDKASTGKGDEAKKEANAKQKPDAPGEPKGEAKGVQLSDALVEQRGRRRLNDYIALAKEVGAADAVLTAEPKTGPLVVPVAVHLGPVRSRWLTAADGSQHLLLVRSAKLNEKTVFQGVILDWVALKAVLLERVADLLPTADLSPVPEAADVPPEHAMTALPVRLNAGDVPAPPLPGWTPLRLGLVIAWAAAVLAIVAVAFGGRAIVATSERRVRFASAVTHELRTPLTALQLHLDLLNSGLITDESKRAEYLATISAEADRLNRLVENVLDFAKLEKRSAQATAKVLPVADVLDAVRTTWADRLAAEGFELVAEAEAVTAVRADPRVVAQVLGNLIDNARKYAKSAADRRVWVRVSGGSGRVSFAVEDRGPGVPSGEWKAVFRPFARGSDAADSGGAGLGLSLARQWAELYGGTLTYQPTALPGARFVLELPAA